MIQKEEREQAIIIGNFVTELHNELSEEDIKNLNRIYEHQLFYFGLYLFV